MGGGARRAASPEVEEAIRPGGISKVKSARIQAILAAIAGDDPVARREPGQSADELSLDWLPSVAARRRRATT